ncbi:hypothetical protein E3N88_12925 [Mikania micrantha]|uniref:Uncharacterized protein n=1 Tax=Mikania micrantha TaxID=192012 RepID=A0A5N6P9V5_9ASTR|nr:hypothetical protein E3N88_12925 [Mikania micrantha]
MASIIINAAMYRACNSPHLATKEPSQLETTRALGTKQDSTFVGLNIKGQSGLITPQEQNHNKKEVENDDLKSTSSVRFIDERWKQGIEFGPRIAKARRRKFLELYPEETTKQEPFLFRSSIIPWWAWITHSHLPEAELLNGRAAMIGFFMAYLVDVLTGLDVVGQSGNFICKIGLFMALTLTLAFFETTMTEAKNPVRTIWVRRQERWPNGSRVEWPLPIRQLPSFDPGLTRAFSIRWSTPPFATSSRQPPPLSVNINIRPSLSPNHQTHSPVRAPSASRLAIRWPC